MSLLQEYSKLNKKVWTLYKEEWCQTHGIPVTKRPAGLVTHEQFEKDLFQKPDFVRQYITEEEFAIYLQAIEVHKLIYIPQEINWADDTDEVISRKMNFNYNHLFKLDAHAQKLESLVGRFLVIPVPPNENKTSHLSDDAVAFYQIVREYKNRVDIHACLDLGDDWIIPEWGIKTKIDKEVALENIQNRGKYIGVDND